MGDILNEGIKLVNLTHKRLQIFKRGVDVLLRFLHSTKKGSNFSIISRKNFTTSGQNICVCLLP